VTGQAAVSVFAPAKINLYLHLVGRRADGYHLLDSLVAFGDIGDRLTAAPADALTLAVGGPEAPAIARLGEDNLVLRAARRFAEHCGIAPRAALYLDKHLPAASGIGGGSSDAAAALRALATLWDQNLDDDAAMAIAAELGADVPACLVGRPVWVGGVGESLDPAARLPPLGIVLANPRKPLPTASVFQAWRGKFAASARFDIAASEPAALIAALARCGNDLTSAALTLMPEIGAVLNRLAALPGALVARMSGSGATCFALFSDRVAALGAGAVLARTEPGWWSQAGALMTDTKPVRLALPARAN